MGSKKSSAPAGENWKPGSWSGGKYKNASGTIFQTISGQGPSGDKTVMGAAKKEEAKKKRRWSLDDDAGGGR